MNRSHPIDIFADVRDDNRRKARPLAARMRPTHLDEFVGQEHFLGAGKLLRRMLLADRLSLAHLLRPARHRQDRPGPCHRPPHEEPVPPLNAVAAGTKEVRELLAEAAAIWKLHGERTILFLDEIHRFNRAQQDVLLPDVEDGVVILIGATTQNPFFAINTPLLSRSQIFTFEPLSREHIRTLIQRALADKERGLGEIAVNMTDEALAFLAEMCDGDARRALKALEIGVQSRVS